MQRIKVLQEQAQAADAKAEAEFYKNELETLKSQHQQELQGKNAEIQRLMRDWNGLSALLHKSNEQKQKQISGTPRSKSALTSVVSFCGTKCGGPLNG